MSDPLSSSSYPERDAAANAKPFATSPAVTTRDAEASASTGAIAQSAPPRSQSVTRIMLAGVVALAIAAAAVAWLDARRTQQLLRAEVAQRLAEVDGLLGGVIALSVLAYLAQRKLWRLDMRAKSEAEAVSQN